MSSVLEPEHVVCTSRASVGIYAVLHALFSDSDVVVPVNICPAAVYPIVYSGNRPAFCDIADYSGNVSLSTISNAITERTRAILVPHMYGNPVQDIEDIKVFCNKKNLVLIEDCASAMGASIKGRCVGQFGDYCIFSTGHAKVVDIGGGGLVCSHNDMSKIRSIVDAAESVQQWNPELEGRYAACYRRYLNTRAPLAFFNERDFFNGNFTSIFVNRPKFCTGDHIVGSIQRELDSSVRFHRSAQARMEASFLGKCPSVRMYRYAEGAVPWRFSFFIDRDRRQKVADGLLRNHISVSDLYPPIGELFGTMAPYPVASKMGCEVLNLPHFMDDASFEKACHLISEILQKDNS